MSLTCVRGRVGVMDRDRVELQQVGVEVVSLTCVLISSGIVSSCSSSGS